MQRIRCDINLAMQQITKRLFLRRNFVTRGKNLYEVLGLNRGSTQVSYFELFLFGLPQFCLFQG